jgi:hypothetical protein
LSKISSNSAVDAAIGGLVPGVNSNNSLASASLVHEGSTATCVASLSRDIDLS